jgi:hypothetical protein
LSIVKLITKVGEWTLYKMWMDFVESVDALGDALVLVGGCTCLPSSQALALVHS